MAHRKATLRNLAQSLIEHGQVRTTLPKAKELRPYIERLVSLARNARSGSITARRQIHKMLADRSMIPEGRQADYEDLSLAKRKKTLAAPSGRRYRTGMARGKLAFTGESIMRRLITEIAPRYEDRTGGFTRLIKLPRRRLGDGGEQAVIQFVGDEESPGSVARPGKTARRRRADARYALAVKLTRQRGAARPTAVAEERPPASEGASSGEEPGAESEES
jgi:large subunit ribosomal protein L17